MHQLKDDDNEKYLLAGAESLWFVVEHYNRNEHEET